MDGKRIRASVIGVSGYTGLETLRILLAHPQVDIAHLTARAHETIPIGCLAPHLRSYDYRVTNTDAEKAASESDVIFLCLPHKTTAEIMPSLMGKCKIIDLSADFRLNDPAVYKRYYEVDHPCPGLLKDFAYGLPERERSVIKGADNVANPGCFALLSQLLLAPFHGQIGHANIMAVTGSSGLGKMPVEAGHHPVRSHNMKSYQVNLHRHTPEILRTAGINEDQMDFVPTSGPFSRGIFATAFINLSGPAALDSYFYDDHPFVREGGDVAVANVTGSNFADLHFAHGRQKNTVIAQGTIDNLVKGASGTAVQNMNLMFGLEETLGLRTLAPVYP
jgi:N-acetyl-gamma-glutamyl-phosphate reductase